MPPPNTIKTENYLVEALYERSKNFHLLVHGVHEIISEYFLVGKVC